MKKRVLPRLVWALFLSFAAFILLSAVQFARFGNFSKQLGEMVVSGRYSNGEAAEAYGSGWVRLDGAASVAFGGLEFRLAHMPAGGFSLVDSRGARHQASPEYVYMEGGEAVFYLPPGVLLSFANGAIDDADSPRNGMPELRISATFPDGISAIDIPFRPRRSAIAWDNARGVLGVTYDGTRYRFSRHSQELLEGRLLVSASAPVAFFRAEPEMMASDLADFVIPRVEGADAFAAELAAWTERSFDLWGRDMPSNVDEDRVVALLAESQRRGDHGSAVSVVPAAFGASSSRTWESAVYQFDRSVGVWERGAAGLGAQEREKVALVSGLLAIRDYGRLFAENQLIEFLAVRGHGDLVDGFVSAAWGIDTATVTLGASAGILESYLAMGNWRAGADNPFEPLAAQAMLVVADSLRQNGEQTLAFTADGQADIELNLRLGNALIRWGEQTGSEDWAALGRSLVFSVMSLGDSFPGAGDGSIPAAIASSALGVLTASAERIGSASLFRMLGESDYLPRAVATGVDGIWAWTAARSVSLTQSANFIDIFVDFPVGQTHSVMLRGIRPFALLQIHNQNTARNPSFEDNHNISGWDYFEEEETLVVKIQHRANVERIRVLFTIPAVAAAPATTTPAAAATTATTPAATPTATPPATTTPPVVPPQEVEPAEPPPPPPPIRRPPTWVPPPSSLPYP